MPLKPLVPSVRCLPVLVCRLAPVDRQIDTHTHTHKTNTPLAHECRGLGIVIILLMHACQGLITSKPSVILSCGRG